eukprot:gene13474-13600_t
MLFVQIAKLMKLRDASKNKLILFTSHEFNEFAATPARDYHLMIFLSTNLMNSNEQLAMPKAKKEVVLAAQAFNRGPNANQVFFVELLYEKSKDVYQRLGITRFPHLYYWGPKITVTPGRAIKLPKGNDCHESIKSYPWPAEDIVQCAAQMSGLEGGEVDRPSILKSPFFPLGLLVFFLVGGYAAWVVYNSPIVRITGLWMLGALAVYCFATGGGMYNIIRGMPLYYRNQQGKLIWWMEGRGGQLGAEGFIMSISYIIFSSAVASLTYVVPKIKNAAARGVVSLVLVLVAAFLAMRILEVWHVKSGLRMRSFLSFL